MAKSYFFRSVSTGRVFETAHPEFYQEDIPVKAVEGRAAIAQQAKEDLLEYVKEGSTVYCAVRSVAPSGLSRKMTLHFVDDGGLFNITSQVARATGGKMSKDGELIVTGGGMDMAFSTVYNLAWTLFGADGANTLRSQII